ncbi:hypothetical protein KMT30_48620, partial [Streptomyces sp. IBSBF 2953]|nr:hypothetical protein [Streptomyces hayashii]
GFVSITTKRIPHLRASLTREAHGSILDWKNENWSVFDLGSHPSTSREKAAHVNPPFSARVIYRRRQSVNLPFERRRSLFTKMMSMGE